MAAISYLTFESSFKALICMLRLFSKVAGALAVLFTDKDSSLCASCSTGSYVISYILMISCSGLISWFFRACCKGSWPSAESISFASARLYGSVLLDFSAALSAAEEGAGLVT